MPPITKKKTDLKYLRDIIKGNEGANQFLDAICEEMTDKDDYILCLEEDIGDLKRELQETQEENEYKYKIDAGIGYIEYDADALPLQSLMETLGEKLKKTSPLKIENRLNAL